MHNYIGGLLNLLHRRSLSVCTGYSLLLRNSQLRTGRTCYLFNQKGYLNFGIARTWSSAYTERMLRTQMEWVVTGRSLLMSKRTFGVLLESSCRQTRRSSTSSFAETTFRSFAFLIAKSSLMTKEELFNFLRTLIQYFYGCL